MGIDLAFMLYGHRPRIHARGCAGCGRCQVCAGCGAGARGVWWTPWGAARRARV